ncbi:MAG: hypothetical protein M3Y18_05355 [Candidatus Eremiobacteraeota bacterium]|nr:hypothetical protein [Candidatus Eremiobacteraeota bacterium]
MKAAKLIASFCAAAFLLGIAPAAAAPPPVNPGMHASLIQKTTARRFKRGIRRTRKKIRHFIRRAAGKH